MATITLINFDGTILKKSPAFIENKTVEQILETIKGSLPNQDWKQYLLAIKTPAYIKFFDQDAIPLSKYPNLVVNSITDMDSIPGFALMVFDKSEKGKMFITYNVSSLNQNDIIFPPYFYEFSPELFDDKNVSDLISDMTKHFGLQILNPKIFLNNQEVFSNRNVKTFLNDIVQTIINQASTESNSCPVEFRFNIEPAGLKIIKMREKVLQEMFDTESTYFKYLTVLNNFIAPEFLKQKILKENDHKLFFGPIPSMIETSAYLANELNKLQKYSSCVAQLFSKFLFDFQKTSGEYFVNYNKKIKYLTEKLDSNPEVKKICQRLPDKGKYTLQSILIMPIQRFPRYVLLLKELSKYTPESHSDYKPLQKVNENLSHMVHEMEEGHLVRGVRDIQKRLEPLKGYQSIVSIDRILVEEFTVSIKDKKKTKSTLYLFNDLILLTTGIEREVEQMRSEYNDFFFIPNFAGQLTIGYFFKTEYNVIEFNSSEQEKKFYNVFNELRNKIFENNSQMNLPTIKAIEYIPPVNQIIPPMIETSCCKLFNSISIAWHKSYMIFDSTHKTITIANGIKNIHNYSKLVIVNDVPYIYGGIKKAGPYELMNNKFDEPKPRSPNKDELPEVITSTRSILINAPKKGRIYHTCCVYDNCIVVYGGINPRNRNTLNTDVLFYNVETGQWFMSDTANASPEPRYKHSAVVYKNLMIIHGGISSVNRYALNDTWCFDFLSGKWQILNFRNSRRIVPRFGHSAVIVNRYMFVIGGSTVHASNNNSLTNKTENDDSPAVRNTNLNSSKCKPTKIHFCVNIETGQMTSLEIEGNFLKGISMFSMIYDDVDKQILIFGGTDSHQRASKGLPIIINLIIPQRYTSESAIPPDGPVEVEQMTIVSSFYSRKVFDSEFMQNNQENAAKDKRIAADTSNRANKKKKKNRCPLFGVRTQQLPEISPLKSNKSKKESEMSNSTESTENEIIKIPSSDDNDDSSNSLHENSNNLNTDDTNSILNDSSNNTSTESIDAKSPIKTENSEKVVKTVANDQQIDSENENISNESHQKLNNLELNDSNEADILFSPDVNPMRNRKFNDLRVQDDQEIRKSIKINEPNYPTKLRRSSLL